MVKKMVIVLLIFFLAGCFPGKSADQGSDNFEDRVSTEVAQQFLMGTLQSQLIQQTETTSQPTTTQQIEPTETMTLEPVPTATQILGRQNCMDENAGVVINFDPSLTEQTILLNALNQGISLTSLNQQLRDYNRASGMVPAVNLDFNQDHYLDIAVAMVEDNSEAVFPAADIYIYFCNQGQYDFVTEIHPPDENAAAKIYYAQDLDHSGGDELLIGSETCGAHSCFSTFEIWSYGTSGFWNRMIGQSNDLPYPDVFIRDDNHDQIYDVEVQYGSAGSVGAGPGRGVLRTWQYQSGALIWQVSSEVKTPSTYRIHVIHDADTAMTAGNYDQARNLYLQVIRDTPPLDDWMNPVIEQENLSAYAYYRLVVLYRIAGQNTESDQWLADSLSVYPAGTIGNQYAQMAEIFANAFDFSGMVDGCQAAALYAGAHRDEVLKPLGSETYGYGNMDYEPTNMCP